MTDRRILSDAQRRDVIAWRLAGWSCEKIARTLAARGTRISRPAISKQLVRAGLRRRPGRARSGAVA